MNSVSVNNRRKKGKKKNERNKRRRRNVISLLHVQGADAVAVAADRDHDHDKHEAKDYFHLRPFVPTQLFCRAARTLTVFSRLDSSHGSFCSCLSVFSLNASSLWRLLLCPVRQPL